VLNLTQSLVNLAPRGTQDFVLSPPGEDYEVTPFNSLAASLYVQYDGPRRIYDRLLVELEVALSNAGVLDELGEVRAAYKSSSLDDVSSTSTTATSSSDTQASGDSTT
jgi:hypothetical protein